MQFDTQEFIQFWRTLVNGGEPSSPNIPEMVAKLFQQPTAAGWQSILQPPTTDHHSAGHPPTDAVEPMARLLREFVSVVRSDWNSSRSSDRYDETSFTASDRWNRFLDLGSDRFKTFAHRDDVAREFARCCNALAQTSAPAYDTIRAFGDLAAGLTETDSLYGEREVVLSVGTMTLYHYAPEAEPRVMPPVLIVYALINTADILDLDPERSLIRALLQQGIPVYLVDWGFPTASDSTLGLGDYIHRRLKPAIDATLNDSASETLNLLGVCQGGILSLSTAALYPSLINKVALAVTPIDFHTPDNLLSHWAREVDVAALVKQHGNIPGPLLYWLFASLNPFELIYRKYLKAATTRDEDGQFDEGALRRFMRMERWVQNVPDHAGQAFEECVTDLYQHNALIQGTFKIEDRPVRLADIHQPTINFYASRDHIVPAGAARALRSHSANYEEVELQGGHIGAIVTQRNIRVIASRLTEWL